MGKCPLMWQFVVDTIGFEINRKSKSKSKIESKKIEIEIENRNFTNRSITTWDLGEIFPENAMT